MGLFLYFVFFPILFEILFSIVFLSKKGVPSSSCRSSSREPGGQTGPGSCRTLAESPLEIDVSGLGNCGRKNIVI